MLYYLTYYTLLYSLFYVVWAQFKRTLAQKSWTFAHQFDRPCYSKYRFTPWYAGSRTVCLWGNIFCCFHAIIRIIVTIMLIISNFWVGFCSTNQGHNHCCSVYNDSICNAKLRDWQERSYPWRLPTISAVLKLLFTLCDCYTDYSSYYAHYFKTPNCVLGQYSLQKSASLAGAEAAHHP